MENFKKFLSKYGAAIVFGVAFILFLGFCALPILEFEVELNGGEYYTTSTLYDFFSHQYLNFNNGELIVEVRKDAYGILTVGFGILSFLIGAIGLAIPNKFKQLRKVFVGTSFGFLAVEVILISFFSFSFNNMNSEFKLGLDNIEYVKYAIALLIITLILGAGALARDVFTNTKFTVQEIVEIGMLMALAIALDKLTLWKAPTGGSVNLSGVPLLILAMRRGPLKGFVGAAFTFGLISCLIDGYGLHTYPFDYFIAFSGYAVCGIAYGIFKKYVFKKDTLKSEVINLNIAFVIGAIGVIITRMIGSSASSLIYFFNYLQGSNKIVSAILYNIAYIGPSAALSCVICCALSFPLAMINRRFPVVEVDNTEEVAETVEE